MRSRTLGWECRKRHGWSGGVIAVVGFHGEDKKMTDKKMGGIFLSEIFLSMALRLIGENGHCRAMGASRSEVPDPGR